jgi:hypothetical protein
MAGRFSQNICQPSYSAGTLLSVCGTQMPITVFVNDHNLILSSASDTYYRHKLFFYK